MASIPSEEYRNPRQRENPHMKRQEAITPEEMAILKECNRESLLYRCIPLSLVGVGAVQYLAAMGRIQPHPRFGTLFKSMGACFLGYIAGKITYMDTCKQKILERIPDSRLAHSFRGSAQDERMTDMVLSPGTADVQDKPLREQYSSFDLNDKSTPSSRVNELDDNLRPTLDRDIKTETIDPDTPSGGLSYDELRQRNRLEHSKKTHFPSSNDPFNKRPFPAPPSSSSSDQRTSQVNIPATGKNQNKYGDSWD